MGEIAPLRWIKKHQHVQLLKDSSKRPHIIFWLLQFSMFGIQKSDKPRAALHGGVSVKEESFFASASKSWCWQDNLIEFPSQHEQQAACCVCQKLNQKKNGPVWTHAGPLSLPASWLAQRLTGKCCLFGKAWSTCQTPTNVAPPWCLSLKKQTAHLSARQESGQTITPRWMLEI